MDNGFERRFNRVVRAYDWTQGAEGFENFSNVANAWGGLNAAGGALSAELERLAGNRDFTQEGRRNRLRETFARDVVPALVAGQAALRAAENERTQIRERAEAAMVTDRTDVVGAMLRSEIRTWLRGLEPGKRSAMLALPDDLSPDVALAIVEAPPELSGVPQGQREALRERAFIAQNPDAARTLERIDAAAGALADMLAVVAAESGRITDLQPHEVAEAAGAPTLAQRIEERLNQAA